jgi:hypothetical protein
MGTSASSTLQEDKQAPPNMDRKNSNLIPEKVSLSDKNKKKPRLSAIQTPIFSIPAP